MSHTIKIVSLAVAIAIGISLPLSHAQFARPQFEVVSVKPNTQGGTIVIGNQRGGRFVAMNVNVRMLFIMAFRPIQDYQILGGPSWLSMERFDIEAKAQGVLTPQQADAAIRAILEDRFQLRTHSETKELQLFELLISKGGPKLKLVNLSSDANTPASSSGVTSRSNGTLPPGVVSSRPGSITASAISMGQLVNTLSAAVGRPVIDKTGLTGPFEINLRYALGAPSPQNDGQGVPADTEVSIFTALQEQLGLKLESSKGPVEVLVIDSVSKPTEN